MSSNQSSNVSGGGTSTSTSPAQPQVKNVSPSDVVSFVGEILKSINLMVLNDTQLFAQPSTQMPSNLQPNQPPPTQVPAATAATKEKTIQVLQKLLMALGELLSMISK
jgi:hypothetical protein